MAIKFAVDKHTVCHPGNLLASNYGEHMVSLDITQDTDNGRIKPYTIHVQERLFS